jgi:release factor glutamine methyltransferase
MKPNSTVEELAGWGGQELRQAGVPAPRNEAEYFLAQCLDTDRGGLAVRKNEAVPSEQERIYRGWIARRTGREPFQYITGEQEFLGHRFLVDSRVLVPRPETEAVVEAALSGLPAQRSGEEHRLRALDIGTGSGCIASSLALARKDMQVDAIDVSEAALDNARENLNLHSLESQVHLHRCDMGSLPREWSGRFDLVVSNPPYVLDSEWQELQPEVRDHEPRSALVAENGGTTAYESLAPEAFRVLAPGGRLVLELGFNNAEAVTRIVRQAGFGMLGVQSDFQGIDRILTAVKSGPGQEGAHAR